MEFLSESIVDLSSIVDPAPGCRRGAGAPPTGLRETNMSDDI